MKRTTLITLILGTALAVAPAAQAVRPTDDGGSAISIQALNANMSQAEYRALAIRSAALDRKYGLGKFATARPAVVDGWTNSISPSYSFRPDILGGNGGVSTGPTATGGNSFDWSIVGIGGATLLSVMLLGGASLAVTRRRHQPSF